MAPIELFHFRETYVCDLSTAYTSAGACGGLVLLLLDTDGNRPGSICTPTTLIIIPCSYNTAVFIT